MPIALLSSEKPNAIINVHSDHLGTPRAMTDSTNQVLWRWEGDAFGDVQPQLATVKMPLRMAGQYEDSETGLFYNYFRFYDPKTGRYVENDPIDLAGGLNRYGYVGGSPLKYTDPTGENPLVGAFGVGWRIGSAINLAVEIGTGQSIGGLIYDLINDEDKNKPNEDFCPAYDNAIFSKGGKQNIDNQYVRGIQYKEYGDGDPCDILKKLYNATQDKQEKLEIKKAMKRFNCDGKNRWK